MGSPCQWRPLGVVLRAVRCTLALARIMQWTLKTSLFCQTTCGGDPEEFGFLEGATLVVCVPVEGLVLGLPITLYLC